MYTGTCWVDGNHIYQGSGTNWGPEIQFSSDTNNPQLVDPLVKGKFLHKTVPTYEASHKFQVFPGHLQVCTVDHKFSIEFPTIPSGSVTC